MTFFDDKERFIDFLKILPEETIESFSLEFSFGGGQYNDWVVDILRKYHDYNKRTESHYINKKIEKKFKTFNNSFRKLYDFFTENFVYTEVGGGLIRYSLLPKLREKSEIEWIQKYQEFYNLYQDFFNRHKRFLITTKKELTKPKKTIGKNLINRDSDGDFYYNNKLIEFKNKEDIYYLIFECLFEEGDIKGFCSYDKINKYLEKNGKDKHGDNEELKSKIRIKNGIDNLFRFSNLINETPKGKKLIEKIAAKGVTLNNPPL